MRSKNEKENIYILSDESGSWHEKEGVYLRSWVAIFEKDYQDLKNIISKLNKGLEFKELKWSKVVKNKDASECLKDSFDFRVFITLSSPKEIKWDKKYKITKHFNEITDKLNFGDLSESVIISIKKKIYDDICNILFLNLYELFHIENSYKRIKEYIKGDDYNLIYKIDNPQFLDNSYKELIRDIVNPKEIKIIKKSEKEEGVQFADVIAGCIRSIILEDENHEIAKQFYQEIIKNKFIQNKETSFINPNFIFHNEMNQKTERQIKKLWKL